MTSTRDHRACRAPERSTVRIAIPIATAQDARLRDPLARAWNRAITTPDQDQTWVAATIERQRGRELEPVHVVAHARRINPTTVTFTVVCERPGEPRGLRDRLRDLYDPPHRWKHRLLRRALRRPGVETGDRAGRRH